MASGIKVTDDIKEMYRRLCLLPTKSDKAYFACIQFTKKNDVIGLKLQFSSDDLPAGEKRPTYDQLISGLPTDDVRYLLYDVNFLSKEGTPKEHVVLLSWHPQCSPVKARLICGSTFSALRQTLSVPKYYIEADCQSEACGAALIEKFGFQSVVSQEESTEQVVTDLFARKPEDSSN